MPSLVIPHFIAYAAALIPGAALFLTFIISAQHEYISWCFPLYEGCASISKAARGGYSLYLFRIMIIPAAVLQLVFWVLFYDWCKGQSSEVRQTSRTVLILGIISAIFLIVYANFLGTEGKLYTFLRRSGIYIYFASTVTAHFLIALNSYRLKTLSLPLNKTWRAMALICGLMVVFALSQAYIKLFIEDHRTIENVIEWNMAIAMHIPFLIFAYHWQKSDYKLTLNKN